MKFDTIIIGGGLSGLLCGISLLEKGNHCAIITTGQSALHFFSGSFDFMSYSNDNNVENVLDGISQLPKSHPYSIIGEANVKSLLNDVKPIFSRMGVELKGDVNKNHYRITPSGNIRPTLFSLSEFPVLDNVHQLPWANISLQNVDGFLDFNTSFIAEGLEKIGAKCSLSSFSLPELDMIRKSPTEMRSTNIARILDNYDELMRIAPIIEKNSGESDVILLPAVFGLHNPDAFSLFKSFISKPVYLLPAIPPSVSGIRTQIQMKNYFQKLGGVFMLGDTVTGGIIEKSQLRSITTINHSDISLKADNFILASGSFFSRGIKADMDRIYEPIFDLDVNTELKRDKWCDINFFNSQPFMSFGVKVDDKFNTQFKVNSISNLYAIGSIVGGSNPIKEGCGAGVSILSALHIANQIAGK